MLPIIPPTPLLPCTVPLFRLEMMVLNPLPPAIPPAPTLYIELAGRFPGGAVVDAAPLIEPLLLHEVTKRVYFIGNERMLIAHDSNRLRFS